MKEQTYRPEHPQYAIAEEFDAFPRELSFGGNTQEEAIAAALDQLIAEPTTEATVRQLDETEIENFRREYTALMEQAKPQEMQVLTDLLCEEAKIKEKIKAQREVLQSITQHVNDCIETINGGTTSEALDASRSFRLAVDGYYLHYTYADGRFLLAKVCRIPSKDADSLFVRQTANQEVFLRMFGASFSPSQNFEERKLCEENRDLFIGCRLAADAVAVTESGSLDRILDRDTVLDDEAVALMLEEGVESVFLYKLTNDSDAAPEA